MDAMLKLGPREGDPVSQFLFKKKSEGANPTLST